MSEFIRATDLAGVSIPIARAAIRMATPLQGGTRITFHDGQIFDSSDAFDGIADALAPVAKAETKKPEPDPKPVTK